MKEPDKKEREQIAHNCRKATFLIEKGQIQKISLRESMELDIHLAGCSICRIFKKQSAAISKMVQALFHGKEAENMQLDEQFKKELQARIDKKII